MYLLTYLPWNSVNLIDQDTQPKKPARHTVSIFTGRKKTRFSHLCSSMIPYPIGTSLTTEEPARQATPHTKFEGNLPSRFGDMSGQSFILISSFIFSLP